mgnify:CR=1 FL=1
MVIRISFKQEIVVAGVAVQLRTVRNQRAARALSYIGRTFDAFRLSRCFVPSAVLGSRAGCRAGLCRIDYVVVRVACGALHGSSICAF